MRIIEILLEYKRDITKQKLGDRLVAAAQRDRNQDIDAILTDLEAMDPTTNKQYVLWLANQYIQGQFRLEDKPRVKDVLEKFIQAKSRLPEKDIGRYTFHNLEDQMDKVFNVELKPQQSADASTFEVPQDVKVLYNGPLGLLAIPKTDKASCELGSGTKWCTAARKNNMFARYSKEAPLYIWRDKNGEKYQFHFGKQLQFMDANDRQIKKELLTQFINQHPVLKQLFKKEISNIAKNPLAAANYASQIIRGRWPEAEGVIAQDPKAAGNYARNVIRGRWPEAEGVIAQDPKAALDYARNVIRGRWPEAEGVIAQDPKAALDYAEHVIKGRWPKGEAAIARDPEAAGKYAINVIRGRWPEAEGVIARDLNVASNYAINVIRGRFPEGEKAIARQPEAAGNYARNVIRGRWPEAEGVIAQDPKAASYYARFVIHGRWPEAEGVIARHPEAASYYASYVTRSRWPEAEEVIAQDGEAAWEYAQNVIKGRWPKGEAAIARESQAALEYAEKIIKGRWPEAEDTITLDPESSYEYATLLMKRKWPKGEKLISRHQQDDIEYRIDTIIHSLSDMDPTENGEYFIWLVNQYIEGQFKLEDTVKVKNTLEKFIQAKPRLAEKDIGKYTFYSLRDAMNKI